MLATCRYSEVVPEPISLAIRRMDRASRPSASAMAMAVRTILSSVTTGRVRVLRSRIQTAVGGFFGEGMGTAYLSGTVCP
ncbi:hypothetical protein GCM10027445_37530 [Amycolatopsis endophytica]